MSKAQESYNKALSFFETHLDAYRRGVGEWRSGRHNGMFFDYVRNAVIDGSLCRIYCRFLSDGGFTRFVVVSRERIGPGVPSGPTWCNQVASLFTWFASGIDMDYYSRGHDGKFDEHDANNVHKNLEQGIYQKAGCQFIEVSEWTAWDVASQHGKVVASAPRLGTDKIGHCAILMPDKGKIVQAGIVTGSGVDIATGFGAGNMDKVKYFALIGPEGENV
jgi:hypothetical protein